MLLAEMAAAAIPAFEADSMVIAAGEVLANAHRHGGGARGLRIGRVGERYVCEISDHGPASTTRSPATCRRAPGTPTEPGWESRAR
jgi:hypothetical protein